MVRWLLCGDDVCVDGVWTGCRLEAIRARNEKGGGRSGLFPGLAIEARRHRAGSLHSLVQAVVHPEGQRSRQVAHQMVHLGCETVAAALLWFV